MTNYQTQFETLSNRGVGLPSSAPHFFTFRLKPGIRREVQVLKSINLMQAVALAKLQKDKYADFRGFLNLLTLLLFLTITTNLLILHKAQLKLPLLATLPLLPKP